MITIEGGKPDLAQIKAGQQRAWGSGNYAAVAARIQPMAELLRVCRPGGSIALANWTPASFVGEMFRTIGRHVPPPAVASPLGWGTEQRLEELLGRGVSELLVRPRAFVFRFVSAQGFADFFRINYGPVHTAFEKLDDAGQAALERDLVELAARSNRSTSSAVAIPAEYLEVVATRGLG